MRRKRGAGRGRKLALFLGALLLAAVVLFFTVTSSQPLVPMRAAPTAEDVGAGREAYHQLREARGSKAGAPVALAGEHRS